jgi:FMN reductase
MTRRVVVLSAGVSVPSSSRLLADQISSALQAQVSARGESVEIEVVELRELAVDLAQSLSGAVTDRLARVRRQVAEADGVVAVSPVFTASYSGLFKMFVDALDAESLSGVPVLVAATAGTPRHSLVLDHAMRPLFSHLRAVVVPTGVFAATDDFGDAGLDARISRAASELAALLVDNGHVGGFAPDLASRHPRLSGHDLPQAPSFRDLLKDHDGR